MVINNPMPHPPIEPPLPEETKQEFIWRESVNHQIAYGISWNPSAGLARAITQNKMVPVTSEFYRTWEGKQIPLQVGEDRKANLRLVFSWENNSVHVWVKPDGIVTTKHQYIWDESILFQQQKGISWNPTAALAKAIIQAGLSPMTSEFYLTYEDVRFPVQVGENLRSGERLVFSWENGRVYVWSKPITVPDPDEPDPEDPPPPLPTPFPHIGLHFSADPDVGVGGTAEFVEFKTLRPEVIKVMTAHNPESIRRLHFDNQSTNRKWVVRVFYKWHDAINADTFVSRTIDDIRRTISTLLGVGVSASNIILEIHNEPNLANEGMWVSWQSGAGFGQFFERVVTKLKPEFPLIKFGFPGLSPGGNDPNRRYNAVQFLNEASTYISRAADVVCMHLYWLSLADLENQIGWIRNHVSYGKPVYITECSNPTPVIRPGAEVGAEYAEAIKMIANYGGVTGLTFFVGSASNSKFHPECFVINQSSRGIAQKIREDL